MKDFLQAYTRYAQFGGRSDRKEFWYFILTYVIAVIVASVIDGLIFRSGSSGFSPLATIVVLGSIVPNWAVTFRRLHDIGKSGWWIFLGLIPLVGGIILIIWYCRKGDPAPNVYGEPPEGSRAV
jgi:uncharacterized membrane protein YhaH (DUF805 family)